MTDQSTYPRLCSRWFFCSVNRCPLSPNQEYQRIHPDDPEKLCKENLRERLVIVAKARAEGVELGDGMTDLERRSGRSIEEIAAERDRISAQRREAAMKMLAAQKHPAPLPPG